MVENFTRLTRLPLRVILAAMQKSKKNPHAVALGRLGGLAKSQKKAEIARKNGIFGILGGRPKKGSK
jgi:hypothetical protein